ncbi:cytochrome c3 family protein [Shewanella sp. KT0246]|nr:cytochrome c3 family protein [Shewanella sp. KT0246]GIU52101.1 cytochrome c [Shewanella sp. KT0246]
MNKLNRRQALNRIVGITAATAGGALVANPVIAAIADDNGNWKLQPGERLEYARLDPMEVAHYSYLDARMNHGCMYAVFDSIIYYLAKSNSPDAEKFSQVQTALSVYGYSGMMGEGTICGNMNGAAMLLNMLNINGEKANDILGPIMRFYENETLPYQSDVFLEGIGADKAETLELVGKPTIARSVLCHTSISLWANVNNKTAKDKGVRCRQLSASIVHELVILLNKAFDGHTITDHPVSETVATCQSCHTESSTFAPSVRANIACDSCHGGHQ